MPRLVELVARQDGVVSRRQVRELGLDDTFVERRLRRREWARLHRGVYVDHTGEPTWHQRCWGAVLLYHPAHLSSETALTTYGLRSGSDRDVIHVAIATERHVTRVPNIKVLRAARLDKLVHPSREPSCVRVEHALLQVAARARTVSAAVAVLGDACQLGRTTPARLVEALGEHPRLEGRRLIAEILLDVGQGAYSALEHRYLLGVERPHGLPTGVRQRRVRIGRAAAYRDVEYLDTGLVVELDGRLGHERAGDRWADVDRDVATAVSGGLTLRLSWQQVLDPCRTAQAVVALLHARGWTGHAHGCSGACPVSIRGEKPALGAGNAPRIGAQAQSWPSRRSSASSTVPS